MVDEIVQTQAEKTPERIAYIEGDRTITYRDFNRSIDALAHFFAQQGIQKGDHVALLLGNEPIMLEAMYSLFRIGAVAIPVNPHYPVRDIVYIVEQSEAVAVISYEEILKPLKEDPIAQHVTYWAVDRGDLRVEEGKRAPHIEREPTDVAMILYTSGTTGRAKGAMLTHENIYANARDFGTSLEYDGDDRVIATLPIFHAFALTVVVHAPLIRGASLILVPSFSPRYVLDVAERHEATVFAGVPTMYHFLTEYAKEHRREEAFRTIRVAISGGSSMPVAMLDAFESTFGVRISEGYGLSEASPVTSFNPLDRERIPGSVGQPIANVEQKIVDAEGKEVPHGEIGELIVRGPNVMKGYYNDEEATARVLKNGWLYTGDLARRDKEGYFYIIDRKDDLMIVGGNNVYPREVEEALYALEEVKEAAVVGVEDWDYGEVPAAYIVFRTTPLSVEEVRRRLAETLATYKLPRYVYALESLPKSATGKVLRHALRKR